MIDPRLLPAAIAEQMAASGIVVHQLAGVVAGPSVLTTAVRPEARRMPQALRMGAQIMAGLDATGTARAWQSGAWMVIEVPRPDPRSVPLSAVEAPPGQIALGMSGSGRPVAWDPRSPLTAHALVVAQNGGGKSVALQVIGLGAAGLPGAQLALIDLKDGGDTWDAFEGSRCLAWPIARDAKTAARVLAACCARFGDDNGGGLYVLIDEVHNLQPAGAALLLRLVKEGRASGIHVVPATQYPTRAAIAKDAKEQLGLRISGRLADGQAAYVAGVQGAHELSRPGDALVSRAGDVVRCQLAIALPEDPTWSVLGRAHGPTAAPPASAPPIEGEDDMQALPPVHPSQAPKVMSAADRAWVMSRLTIEGRLPGVNRTAKRLEVGNSTADRWLSDMRDGLLQFMPPQLDLGFGPEPSGASDPSGPSREGVVIDFQAARASRLG